MSMQTMESIAHKMADLPVDSPDPPPLRYRLFFSNNLLGQSIQTSMLNLESLAQKISGLWQLVQNRTDILCRRSSLSPSDYTVQTSNCETVLSFENIC